VVNKLREAARVAAQDPKTIQIFTSAGTSFQFQDMPEFDKFVQDDAKAMLAVLQKIGKVN
jgi:tripartite-type tricarboxylate transporter receptor subunit TctC